MNAALADCPLCAAHELEPGETVTCACGAVLTREAAAPGPPSLARMVDTLLRDAHALALWLQHASVRAISLEPDRAPRSDESDEAREGRRESLLTRGKAYAARLDALTADERVAAERERCAQIAEAHRDERCSRAGIAIIGNMERRHREAASEADAIAKAIRGGDESRE